MLGGCFVLFWFGCFLFFYFFFFLVCGGRGVIRAKGETHRLASGWATYAAAYARFTPNETEQRSLPSY
ncbi:MAG: hypothetical protein ACKERF_02110, partial [Candidatus Hodgkinia cicadicola]